MEQRHHELPSASHGTRRALCSLHFGQRRTGAKAYLQASLHADEVPPMLVAHHLRTLLAELDEAGAVPGEIVLVPMANPIGLSQSLQGAHHGRFDMASGINFNRQFQHLTDRIGAGVGDRWTDDASANTRLIREAAGRALAELVPATETDALKRLLQSLAIDADIVLDLHCDHEATLHVYAGTPQAELAAQLARRLRAQALLLCACSGDDPFDESLSRHWWELAERFDDRPISVAGCFAATVELRGETDVDDALAIQDATALVEFLQDTGHILGRDQGHVPALPQPRCAATPLEGVQPLIAGASGILVFHRALGDRVKAGECVAEIVDPATSAREPVIAEVDGTLFARVARRWATRGLRLGKIAGPTPFRSGKLLSL
ncbi:succinylglutamate desuccinylase/aspartoacylase family protein [Roseateles chitosanitabidus]|uniref:succinylglutamate desuccinylase/aspartoacylase family protein n=1 Tax=Roseateles chitosanitabidus TaxID=65048 RepID=UPI00082BCEC2|nr:succinylglutamate desuccinylase/aspartoacylase family protein [Roseateles chitosanitabidus]